MDVSPEMKRDNNCWQSIKRGIRGRGDANTEGYKPGEVVIRSSRKGGKRTLLEEDNEENENEDLKTARKKRIKKKTMRRQEETF